MEWPLLILVAIVACLYIVPKCIVFVLCFLLRKFSFYASVGGPLTLNEVMLRIPLKMNWAILIRVDQVKVQLGLPGFGFERLISVYVRGLQINLLLRDDFEKWNSSKLELLHVIEQFRHKLSRLGLLNDHNTSASKGAQEEESHDPAPQAEGQIKDWSETINRLLDSSTLVLQDTSVSLFVYQMDWLEEAYRNIDTVNIQMFYQRCIQSQDFHKKYNCARLQIGTAQANFVRMNEDDFEVMIKSPQLLILNSRFEQEYGQLSEVELLLKVPREVSQLRDFCNWELNCKIQSGQFDVSKAFIKQTVFFFNMVDTMATIYKELTNLVYKQQFQDLMFFKKGSQHRMGNEREFENHRDLDIPKKIKLHIVDALEVDITYPSERLKSFLAKSQLRNLPPGFDTRLLHERLRITLAPKTTFEMTFRINKTYFMQIEIPRIDLAQNGTQCLSVEGFRDTVDFTMKQERTFFKVKQSPLELNQNIAIERLSGQLSPSLVKHALELMNYYKCGVAKCNIKHKIFNTLQDPTFLVENIIEGKNSKYLDSVEVIEIYELESHLDQVSTLISINTVDLDHCSHQIYAEQLLSQNPLATYPFSFAADASLAITGLSYRVSKIGKTEETITKCATLLLSQHSRMTNSQRAQHSIPSLMPKDSRPLIKASQLTWQSVQRLRFASAPLDPNLPLSDRENYKIVNQRLVAQALQLNIDFEFMLDRTRDILDYSFVLKHFLTKWSQKYNDISTYQVQTLTETEIANQNGGLGRPRDRVRPRSMPWREVVESRSFYFPMGELIWNLSRARMLVLTLEQFRPTGISSQCFERIHVSSLSADVRKNFHEFVFLRHRRHSKTVFGDDHFDFCTSKAAIYYCKEEQGMSGESEPIQIITASDLRLALDLTDKLTSVGIKASKVNCHLPHNLVLGGLSHEIDKQISHVPAWIREQYLLKKRELNFQYSGHRRNAQQQQREGRRGQEQRPPPQADKNPWCVDVNFKEAVLSMDDDPMLQTFTNHDEIVEMLAQRQVFLCPVRQKLALLKQLKKSAIYQKYFEWKVCNLSLRYEMPARFKDQDHCIKWVRNLDEAHSYIEPRLFEHFDGNNLLLGVEYLALHGRSMFKPVVELWNLDARMELMNVELNSSLNPGLFETEARQCIFDRFPLLLRYNKLPKRFYYMAQIDLQRLKLNIQGQQTLLFFNDLTNGIDQFTEVIDMSKSFDARMQKLPVLGGTWDQLRTMRRGSGQIKIKEVEVEVRPKRTFSRYSESLLIQCNDFQYNKRVVRPSSTRSPGQTFLKHDYCLRNLVVKKEPLKQFESALLHFPLIELSVSTNYNQGKELDHFKVIEAHDYAHYVSLMRAYSTKQLTVQVKLNIPSLGTINPTREKSLYLPLLMQSYVLHSPVPIVNYQRSHMKFIDELLQEYINGGKIDISASVKAKKARRQGTIGRLLEARHPILEEVQSEEVNSKFCLQVQVFLNDMMILFTDFDESVEGFKLVPQSAFEENETAMGDAHTIEPEHIDDDSKRDDYLNNYQGIVFTTENLSLATTILVDITGSAQKFQSENSFFKNKFLCLHTLNSANLFQLRNRKLNHLRKAEQPNTMDNYRYFCRFFGIDLGTQERYASVTREFKTMFPAYVLHNDSLQHDITTATGGYESAFGASQPKREQEVDDPQRTASLFGETHFGESVEEDLNFRDCGTFFVIELMEYQQNQFIAYQAKKENDQNSNCDSEPQGEFARGAKSRNSQQAAAKHQSDHSALQYFKRGSLSLQFEEQENSGTSPGHSNQVLVRHLLDVKNARFLYTRHVYEMIHHHLVRGFDFTKYRKTDYIDVERQQTKKRNFLDGYLESSQNYMTESQGLRSLSVAHTRATTQKEAYIGVRLINPQVNMQDGPSKAQALITSEGAATAVFFAYSEPEKASASAVQIMKKTTKEGAKWNTNIVKNEICLQLDKMNLYVAPTYINLEKPTFWKPNGPPISRKSDEKHSPTRRGSMPAEFRDGEDRASAAAAETSQPEEEIERINALRKVLSFTTVALKFVFLDKSQINHQNPLLDIDFQLKSVNCQMDGPSMWRFLGVFKGTFLDRGEKSEDVVLTEEARAKDLKEFKPDQLREMIDRDVKSKMGSLLSNQKKPIFSKRVSYAIDQLKFSFYNLDTKFASGSVEQARGMHWIYATRESKNDIDVEKISLFDHLDQTVDEPRCVLQPQGRRQSEGQGMHVREAMLKLRTRDKFVVVSQAPWRVFDQYEIFIYPTTIQLTRLFYSNMKNFMFENKQNDPVNEAHELQDHYDVLISTKALEKALPSAANNRQTSDLAKLENLSDNSRKQKKLNFLQASGGSSGSGQQRRGKQPAAKSADQQFQSFFRYLRINEIQVQITYIHGLRSSFNVHNMALKLQPFIMHGKFQTMQQVLNDYEKHCKSNMLRQTPNLLKKLIFKGEQFVHEATRNEDERSAEIQLHYAKRLLFGDLAYSS